MNSRYKNEPWALTREERKAMRTYLSGLFTSKYKNEFMLHYVCPLCGDQINVVQVIPNASELQVDYEKDVAGSMMNNMRHMLADHYKRECGSDRERRSKTAGILVDKFMDKVYE